MLGYARGSSRIGQESSISYIILSWLERSLGRSQVPWIAQFEQLLAKNNQYENFCAFVAETTASDGDTRQWVEIRNDAALAHPLLVQGLHKFLPRTHKSLELAAESVRLAEQKKVEPEEVVRRLVSEAKASTPRKVDYSSVLTKSGFTWATTWTGSPSCRFWPRRSSRSGSGRSF